MTKIAPQPGIMEIAPYVGGQSAIAGRADALKLSSNENPLGPPPAGRRGHRAGRADGASLPVRRITPTCVPPYRRCTGWRPTG